MRPEENDEEVYDGEGRQQLVEDDEIDPSEGGFMEGYERDGGSAKCATCGEPLSEDPITQEIDDEVVSFCSEDCFKKYEKR